MAKERMGHCQGVRHVGPTYCNMMNSSDGRCNTCTRRDAREVQAANAAEGRPSGTVPPGKIKGKRQGKRILDQNGEAMG
jgi:hypothetical protein